MSEKKKSSFQQTWINDKKREWKKALEQNDESFFSLSSAVLLIMHPLLRIHRMPLNVLVFSIHVINN